MSTPTSNPDQEWASQIWQPAPQRRCEHTAPITGPEPPYPNPPTNTSQVGRIPSPNQGMPHQGQAMFAELPHQRYPSPPHRAGTYRLCSMNQTMTGPMQRILDLNIIQTSLPTLPGTNQYPLMMPQPLPLLNWPQNQRSSPSMTLMMNLFHHTPCQEIAPGHYAPLGPYPDPTGWEQYKSQSWHPDHTEQESSTSEDSQMSQTHQTLTPMPRTPSPLDSEDSQSLNASTCSNSTITEGHEPRAIHLTPLGPTMSGPTSLPLTKKCLALNELPPGKFDRQTLTLEPIEASGIPTSGSPWTDSSQPIKETTSNLIMSRPRSQPTYLPMDTNNYTDLHTGGPGYIPFNLRQTMNSYSWRLNSWSFLTNWMNDYGRRGKTTYNRFVYDDKTFGHRFQPSQIVEDVPEFYLGNPFPLPDLPPQRPTISQ
ncbi:hypothetical protein ARMGADRAFT_1090716 [Armillaria gallica]|uniref:Uncharacterized protein n=1 Tax=Armillaria gallica TaxID=47427 RepID=A0A2H3CG26_ARMGA|nr:hypothetical protein ARMGADRAFT_1090716 [Armillaria gallica]